MDERSQKLFSELMKKSVKELTPDDIRFIRARRSYLEPQYEEKFKDILEEKVKEIKSKTAKK